MTLEQLLADAAWVRRVAAALVSEPADAEDVAQQTLVTAIERPPLSNAQRRNWLAVVARNIARMMGRTASRRSRRELLLVANEVPSPEALVERAELQRQLATLLTELDEPYRSTILLCYFEDASPSEIAHRLSIPAGTVRWRLKRGLEHLRAGLDRLHANRRSAWLLPMTAFNRAAQGRHLSLALKGSIFMANKTAIAAGIGALAATTALVTVQESRALLANRHQRTESAAPSHTQTDRDQIASSLASIAARMPPPPEGATREELLKRDAEQRAELARLRAELAWARGPNPFHFPANELHGEDFFKPPKDELLRMAKDCMVKWDAPELSIPPSKMPDEFALAAGVSDDERREFDSTVAEFSQSMITQLRALYVEETGDKAGADSLSPETMINEMREKAPEAVTKQAYWLLSQERAGLSAAATDTSGASAFERFLRLEMSAGDRFESALGQVLGPARAHELRTEQGGWGTRHILSGCPSGR